MTERVVWEAGSSACVDGQGLEIISIPSLIRVVVHSSRCPLGPKLVGGSTPEAYVPERGGLVGASCQGLPSRFHALLLLLRLGLFRRGRWPRPFGGGCNAAPAHRVRGQTAHLMRGVAAVWVSKSDPARGDHNPPAAFSAFSASFLHSFSHFLSSFLQPRVVFKHTSIHWATEPDPNSRWNLLVASSSHPSLH